MTDLILPDSRWEQPELAYPNRKPVGNVKIDWGHPLTKGLKICVVPQVGKAIVNLVDGIPTDNLVNPKVIPSYDGEQILKCSEDGTEVDLYHRTNVHLDSSVVDHSIVCGFRQDVTLATEVSTVLSSSNTANKGVTFSLSAWGGVTPNQTGKVRLTYQGVAGYATSSGSFAPNGSLSCCGISGTMGGDYDYIVNGKFSSNIVVGTPLHDADTRISICGRVYSAGDVTGEYAYIYYWERRISESESLSIKTNPYQFLIPA